MTAERPTPEVDALLHERRQIEGRSDVWDMEDVGAFVKLARRLERERDEARERLEAEKAANEQYAKHTRELLDERERLTERLEAAAALLREVVSEKRPRAWIEGLGEFLPYLTSEETERIRAHLEKP